MKESEAQGEIRVLWKNLKCREVSVAKGEARESPYSHNQAIDAWVVLLLGVIVCMCVCAQPYQRLANMDDERHREQRAEQSTASRSRRARKRQRT